MSKKKFDFVLLDDKPYYRDVFRFYPKQSHVHGFTDEPPTDWTGVYKVYYSWKVMRQYYNDDTEKIEPESANDLFNMPWDECSEITNLAGVIRHVVETHEDVELIAFGQPASEWSIKYIETNYDWLETQRHYIKIVVWDNFQDNGYRFSLDLDEALKFAEYLDKVNDYMLKHSEGI